jgi:metal-sulfur cluster biosynthetic enzyme
VTERGVDITRPDEDVIQRASRALETVIDPELGVDVVRLGLVYDMRPLGDRLEVDMTLTTPGCPVSEQLPREAEAALAAALPELDVQLRVVWEPPWTPARLSPEAMDLLGFRPR